MRLQREHRPYLDRHRRDGRSRAIFPHGEIGNQIIRSTMAHQSVMIAMFIFCKDNGRTWQSNQLTASRRDQRPGGTLWSLSRHPRRSSSSRTAVSWPSAATIRWPIKSRFGFKLALSFTRDLEVRQVEASESPAVTSGQRPVMLRLAKVPILPRPSPDQEELEEAAGS